MALSTSAAERKAEDYIQQGEKALKKFSIFSSGTKWEDASDCFEKAGNQYKIAKKWQEAGDAYARCADCQIKLKESSKAAQYYQQAGDALRKVNTAEAVNFMRTAISMYCDAGRFTTAAKIQKEIAETYESEDNLEEAIENYKEAADYYQGENQTSSANNMLLKVAQFSAQLERYEPAMEIYESIATQAMDNNILKFNAKKYLLDAGICALAMQDEVLAIQKKEKYDDIDYSFADSREGKLFNAMAEAYENMDVDAFADAIYQYDSISKLDAWKISVLLRVKEGMQSGGDEAVSLT